MRDLSNHETRRAPERDVAITGVETCVVAGNFDWNLVRVHTDADVTGLGESYRGAAVTDVVAHLGDLIEGENPLDVERLFDRMVQETSGHGGTTGKVVTAASGVEIALWDLAGKLLDVPVYQLLGGKYRDRVRTYCDCHAGDAYAVEEGYHDPAAADAYDPDAYAATAEAALAEGFTALKFDLDVPHHDHDPDPVNGRVGNAALAHKESVVAAVRDAVGDDVDLAVDCHWDYTVETAVRLARRLEPYDLMWLEDPVPPENEDAQRAVTEATAVPVATGENRFRVHEFSGLLYDHAVDVVTPDPTTCGGLAESKAVADRAAENYIPFSPHNVCSPVGTMACAHLCAAVPNADVLEFHARDVPWWDDLLARSDPLIEDGYVEVPEAPGLGVALDEAVVREHLAEPGTMFEG